MHDEYRISFENLYSTAIKLIIHVNKVLFFVTKVKGENTQK